MDEIVKEFLVESYENLDLLDRAMVELEKDPRHKPSLDNVFRTIHTVKGTCGFLAFGNLEKLAHTGENLLGKIRDGKLALTSARTSGLLSMVDAIRQALAAIEATGKEPGETQHAIIGQLTLLTEQEGPIAAPRPAAAPVAVPAATPSKPVVATPKPAPVVKQAKPAKPLRPVVPAQPLEKEAGSSEILGKEEEVIETAPEAPEVPKVQEAAAATAPVVAAVEPSAPTAAAKSVEVPKGAGISDSTIRVDVGLLDKLMNLVGELVLARNQVLQFTSQHPDTSFQATSQRLNLITTELQGSVMKTRMQPIDNIWSKLPRVVRDMAQMCGKEVRIEMTGKETELDKTIIEAIKDPLTHIVRNSVDHGIESPAVREARGKTPDGCLKMRAYHEGGQVNIEITDDGGGIDTGKVKAKALQRGLITPENAGRMSEHEALHLIFLPGFSTAEKITNLSGRGVGMDVVKTNIEKIGGTVDMQSQVGEGTTLKIKIPLTLAIIPALVVSSGGERFAIPQVNLLELVRLESGQAQKQIEFIHGAPVYRLRGQLLPLVYLNRELQLDAAGDPAQDAVSIVVLQADGHAFGLVVDKINDTEEIVVKPLGKQLKGVACFAGATIMGDGRVALILDVLSLAQRAKVVTGERESNRSSSNANGRRATDSGQTLLLFELGPDSRMAIPLSVVARLEEFPRTSIERSGQQEVIRYRGQIMPLIRVANYVAGGTEADDETGSVQVVVYSEEGRSIGLLVGRIKDIVQETITVKRHAHNNGIFGSVVIHDRVTDLLDVRSVIRAADPSFYPEKKTA